MKRPFWQIATLMSLLAVAGCAVQDNEPPEAGECRNAELTAFDELLIIAPHPDDEVLGFAGLAGAYVQQGKSVRTVVVTDGDAYCEACALWTTGSVDGKACDAPTLSNFQTNAVDSLAEARRIESTNAATVLGRPAPEFLGYPDTGLGAAKRNVEDGDAGKLLRRSDFSACESCEDCGAGYGGGPETNLSAETLIQALDEMILNAPGNTLVATTHWNDGHGDHAALGSFVRERVKANGGGHTVAFAVIHANTSNGHAFADCWYPGPVAAECPCFDNEKADRDPDWLAALRAHRERPDWPQVLPNDADYGAPVQFCLDGATQLAKPRAIDAFQTQLGTVGQSPGILPASRKGLLDCSSYLRSFGRRTEVFVVEKARE